MHAGAALRFRRRPDQMDAAFLMAFLVSHIRSIPLQGPVRKKFQRTA